MIKTLLIVSGMALFSPTANAQDKQVTLESSPAVVLPVFYVVKLDVEGYKVELPTSNNPAPQIVYSQPVDRNYLKNTVSPQVLLQKLSDNIDAKIESKP
tara:strand:+ start:19505 stop:19801 length:297 start_codon:yes stop_codon:yes gene_type:complete